MAITRTAIIDDDGSGTTGTVIDNAWKQEFYNQIDALAAGPWTNIPFDATNYTASGSTWTVSAANQDTLTWCQVGNVVFLVVTIVGTSTVSTPTSYLYLDLSPLPAPSRNARMPFNYLIPGVPGVGQLELPTGLQRISFLRDIAGTGWPAGTGQLFLMGALFWPVA